MTPPDYARMSSVMARAVTNKRAHIENLRNNPRRQHEVEQQQSFLADLESVAAFFAMLLQRRADHQKTPGSTS